MDRPKPPSSERDRKFIAGIYRFLAALWFGIPLLVVVAYYVFGWQAAVLALPALLVSFFVGAAPKGKTSRNGSKFAGLPFLLALWIIPIAATVSGHSEIMRLWAYAMVIPIGVMSGLGASKAKSPDKDSANTSNRKSFVSDLLMCSIVTVIFVAASEAIWRFLSFGAWIWFHAFAMTIIMFLLVTARMTLDRFFDVSRKMTIYNVALPAGTDNDGQTSYATSSWPTLRLMLHYGSISEQQAQAIVADPDFARTRVAELTARPVAEIPAPEFMGLSMGAALKIIPNGDKAIDVEWHYSEAPAGLRPMGAIHVFKAKDAPFTVAPDLIHLAWTDDWAKIEPILGEYVVHRKEG